MSIAHRWGPLLWAWIILWSLWPAPVRGTEGEEIPYVVLFAGLEQPETSTLEPLLRTASLCEQEKASPPANRSILLHRVKQDEAVLVGALRSRGYFAAQVTAAITHDSSTENTPAQILFTVDAGPLYHWGHIEIQVLPPDDSGALHPPADGEPAPVATPEPPPTAENAAFVIPTAAALSLTPGEEAIARKVFAAEEHLLQEAKKQGFAFAKLAKRHTQVDHDRHTLDLHLRIEVGPRVWLGAVQLTGTEQIATDYLRKRIPWPTEQPTEPIPFHPQRIEELRHAMMGTGLFNAVRIHINPEADAQGLHPIHVDLSQRKHRSVGAGIGYSTGTGAKVAANWENRNLFESGETVQVKGAAAMNLLHLESAFGKPDFLQMQQKLLISASLDKEDTEAFYKDSFGVDAGLSRPLAPQLELSYGVGYRLANEKDRSGRQQEKLFGLISTPVKMSWDRRDNLLEPGHGWYLNLLGAGIADTLDSGVWFGKFSGQYRRYYTLPSLPELVLAGRIGAGTILGSSRENVPADERFLVGGGGSVRGYGFQMAGEVDKNNKPLGGRSQLEFSAESRLQATDSLGMVLFLDGGRAFVASLPEDNEPLLLGAGGGIRYKTPIGPLRLDVGTPLHRRPVVDDPY
ncbi:MAG: BamA/TamA family outer membrane protein, partial [Magnetococcales bacterium]|nr:BamA/TamA family outer membrane protein [Magnetococcales bacterium]